MIGSEKYINLILITDIYKYVFTSKLTWQSICRIHCPSRMMESFLVSLCSLPAPFLFQSEDWTTPDCLWCMISYVTNMLHWCNYTLSAEIPRFFTFLIWLPLPLLSLVLKMLPSKLCLPVINKKLKKKKPTGEQVAGRNLPVINGPSFHPSGFLTSSIGIWRIKTEDVSKWILWK